MNACQAAWSPTKTRNAVGAPPTLGFVDGTPATSRPFPASISGCGQVEVFVVVRRPACRKSEGWSADQIPVEREALGVHHSYDVLLSATGPIFGL